MGKNARELGGSSKAELAEKIEIEGAIKIETRRERMLRKKMLQSI